MAFVNPYAERLSEFSSFAFNEPDIYRFNAPGQWPEFFRARMSRAPARLVVEAGCSHGVFLAQIAKLHRDTAFIGIDWKFKGIYKGAKRVESEKLANVALIRARAQELPKICAPGDIDELWVFFPDPWAKKAQLKHRLLEENFLMGVRRLLKPDGRILIKTDHPGYFQWLLALFAEPEPRLPEYSAAVPAERSYRARQIKVRRLESETLPGPSDALRDSYRLARYSTDFWGEAERPATLFGEEQTQFEKLFVKDGLPIYYVELACR